MPNRLSKLLPLLLIPILLTLLLPGAGPQAAPTAAREAPGPDSAFGVAGAMRWPDWGTFSQPAEALLDSGAAWVRADFAWALLEPQEGRFQWEGSDRIVGVLAERKVNILGILSYSANWATPVTEDDGQGGPSFYPPDLTKYYSFVRTMAERYKGRIEAWEVWNEPNNGVFWKPGPNPQQYAEVLKTAYRAVKDGDPNALVLSGGMSGNAVPFMEDMLAAGAGASFDVLALHPYAVPADMAQARAESSPEVHKLAEVEMPKYRAMLERHGINKQIWVTEIGWPANDWQLDPNLQADYMVRAYALLLGGGIAQKVFWYSFKDEGASNSQSWGLLGWAGGNMDLSQKRPAFTAYNTMARLLTGAKPLQIGPSGDYRTVADFEAPIAWRKTSGASGSLTMVGNSVHSGAGAAKLEYNFATRNQSVDLAPPEPIAIPGQPKRIGAWIRGDSSGNYLSAWLRDAGGELFKLRLGAVDAVSAGWRYYEAPLDSYFFPWEKAAHTSESSVDHAISYPVSFVAFRLENTPDIGPGAGAILIDDLQVSDSTTNHRASFGRSDGSVVDVLWSSIPTNVAGDGVSTVLDRDGKPTAWTPDSAISIGPSPVYAIRDSQVGSTGANTAAECLYVRPATAAAGLFFQETGHNLGGLFRQYWESHGSVSIFGYPLSEEFWGRGEDGKGYLMQYFERARFELHPEQPATPVLLSLLGSTIAQQRGFGPAAPKPGAAYAPETGHNVALLRDWWEAHGGIPVFGYPVSEELTEQNPADGKSYVVQYFERNRLEYHAEHTGTPEEVMLGLLGAERLRQVGCIQ